MVLFKPLARAETRRRRFYAISCLTLAASRGKKVAIALRFSQMSSSKSRGAISLARSLARFVPSLILILSPSPFVSLGSLFTLRNPAQRADNSLYRPTHRHYFNAPIARPPFPSLPRPLSFLLRAVPRGRSLRMLRQYSTTIEREK